MKFVCANADLVQDINLHTDYDYLTIKSKSIIKAVEILANSFTKSKSDCVIFVWDSDDPYDLVRATEQASLEDVDFGKIIDELKNNLNYSVLGDFDLESIELENGMTISVVKYVTMNNFIESKKSARKSLKEERVTDGGFYSDVMFDLIKKLKLKKEYYVERPSWGVFDFSNKNKDVKFGIYFDEDNQTLYGDVLGFSDTDTFKYKTDIVDVDSFNIMKECKNIIEECLYFIEHNNKITIFESKESARKSINESADDNWYKLKMLNEMLDAIEEDEYNIPKLGINGVTKNIDLDEGAIKALIKYYK